ELELSLSDNQIGLGPRRALCSEPEEVEAREPQLRGVAGATAVVESLRELPQLTEVVVYLGGNTLGEEAKEELRATFAALPVHQKGIRL
ncbi:Nlrc3, partial [Symbiodinium necroappetens]